ncbi:MAG: hypothetical protein HDT00_00300 [Bacteroidales bacterium]|nr:hypothetical protein [Bacteroidales bacterium]
MKKPAFTYAQIHGFVAGVLLTLKLIAAVVCFFGLWWALWIFQPLLDIPM